MTDKRFIQDAGIILQMHDSKDYDTFLKVFTKENGKQFFLAKSLRKPQSKFKSITQAYQFYDFEGAAGKVAWRLTGLIPFQQKNVNEKDLVDLSYWAFFADLVDQLLPESLPEESVYFLLYEVYLNFKLVDRDILAYYFMLKLLDILGYGIDVSYCSACGAPFKKGRDRLFVSLDGDIFDGVCAQNITTQSLSYEASSLLFLLAGELPLEKLSVYHISQAAMRELWNFFDKRWEYLLEKRLKSRQYLQSLIDM